MCYEERTFMEFYELKRVRNLLESVCAIQHNTITQYSLHTCYSYFLVRLVQFNQDEVVRLMKEYSSKISSRAHFLYASQTYPLSGIRSAI